MGMFKYSSLLGTFTSLLLNTMTGDPINMIYSISSGSLGSCDPWLVSNPLEVDSYGFKMSLSVVEISY